MTELSGLLLADGGRVRITTFAGKRLDVGGGRVDDGAPLIQWDPLDVANQLWVVTPHGTAAHPDEVVLIAAHSGRVLDISSPADGMVAIQEALAVDTPNPNQLWRLLDQPDGTVEIRSARQELTLDVAGANPASGAAIIAWAPNGAPNQRFRLEAA